MPLVQKKIDKNAFINKNFIFFIVRIKLTEIFHLKNIKKLKNSTKNLSLSKSLISQWNNPGSIFLIRSLIFSLSVLDSTNINFRLKKINFKSQKKNNWNEIFFHLSGRKIMQWSETNRYCCARQANNIVWHAKIWCWQIK